MIFQPFNRFSSRPALRGQLLTGLTMTEIRKIILTSLLAVIGSASLAVGVFAGPRAYVSAQTGSDNNPCTVTSPCRQIRHALSVVDLAGEVVVLDSGHYIRFTVRKSVSVIGAPGTVVIIDRPEDPNDIFILDGILVKKPEGAGNSLIVVLRNLTLAGGRHGINFFSGDVLHVEDCVIDRFTENGIELNRGAVRFPGDPPTGSGDARLFVKDTIIRKSGASAVFVSGGVEDAVEAVIEHCRLENNEDGVNAGANARVTVRDSVIAGSHGRGVFAGGAQAPIEVNVDNCLVANGQTGVDSDLGGRSGGVVVRLSHSTITHNVVGVNAVVGSVLSRGNNTIEGNGTNVAGSLGSYTAR